MTVLDDILDLRVGERTASFRYYLMDVNMVMRELHPLTSSIPKIENNFDRTIKRALSGLVLSDSEQADIDTLRHGIKVYMTIPVRNPTTGVEVEHVFPLGYFLFGDASRARHSYGMEMAASLVDRTYILDQAVEHSISYASGQSIHDALREQFSVAGIPLFIIDSIGEAFATPVAWPAGTSRYKILSEMASMAGCFAPYFDNDGIGRVRKALDLSIAPIDHVYQAGRNITSETILESDDILTVPNRYIVIDNANTTAPVVGFYDVPDTAPYSIASRGFVVAKVIDAQGIESDFAATQYAQTAYQQDNTTYQWVNFSGPIDPRHDTFGVVEFLGNLYREQSWQMPLKDGADMVHDIRRVWVRR